MATEEGIADLFLYSIRPPSEDDEGLSSKSSTRTSTGSKWSDDSMMLESVRESTEFDLPKSSDDQSMMMEEEEGLSGPSGTKRKIIEVAEEEEDSEYDSSDDEESDLTEEEEEKKKDRDCEGEEESVELTGSDGVPVTDAEILGWMKQDSRSPKEKEKLLPKIRRYLNSINDNEGFDCIDYPGHVSGITRIIPRKIVIDLRVRYPEGYNHLMYMGSLALKCYNEKHKAEFSIKDVKNVMISRTKGTVYYITLTATSGLISKTFQAEVWDDIVDMKMEVVCCKQKASPSIPGEDSSPDTSSGEEFSKSTSEESDLLTKVSSLHAMSETEMLNLIKYRCSTKEDEEKLMLKVRKYLESILHSKGFKCSNFPGRISGVSILIPRQKLIDEMDCFTECYSHLLLMAQLAIDFCFKDNKGDELLPTVSRVHSANLWRESDCCYTYYIRFTASKLVEDYEYERHSFEAQVQDRQHFINVKSCRLIM